MLDTSFRYLVGVWDHNSDQDIPGLNILLDAFKFINSKINYGCSSKTSKE